MTIANINFVMGGGGTLVSFTPKVENVKKLKKIVRLTLIDALMCPMT